MKRTIITDDVCRYDGPRPGPVVSIVGGVHGNERTGIVVVRELWRLLDDGDLKLDAGSVILALGNPLAIERNMRGSTPGANLNACFTPAILNGHDGGHEERRARELAGAFAATAIGIDIHATNSPSEPFVLVQRPPTPADRLVLRHIDVARGICDPALVFAGEPVTLDEFFAARGVGVCYETGYAEDISRADTVLGEMIGMLRAGGWIRGAPSSRSHEQEWSVLRERIVLTERGFTFAPRMGTHNFQRVAAGELIGHHGDEPLFASEDAAFIFPKPAHLRAVHEPVTYLATPLARTDQR